MRYLGYFVTSPKCPQRNDLCNLLFIVTLIGDLDRENQDVQSDVCRGYSVPGTKEKYYKIQYTAILIYLRFLNW